MSSKLRNVLPSEPRQCAGRRNVHSALTIELDRGYKRKKLEFKLLFESLKLAMENMFTVISECWMVSGKHRPFSPLGKIL
jgi:hypothetical protein